MSIAVGFTGTQRGMTKEQMDVLVKQLLHLTVQHQLISEAHHGLCIGADAQFHKLCFEAGIPIYGHPPSDKSKMATLEGFVELMLPQPYLVRNKNIVRGRDVVFGTPYESKEKLRSGTWSTIRFAQLDRITTIVILPDGSIL